MSITTLVIISSIIIVFLIWLGFKAYEWDNGDNFSRNTLFILISISFLIICLIFLMIIRSNNGTTLWDIGSLIVVAIPVILLIWDTIRVFSTNRFFTALLILFYHLILIAISPLLFIVLFWMIGKVRELFSSFFRK